MNAGDLYVELLQLREAVGACSCGNSTALGVIHSDTRPCYLPTTHMPLTDEQIADIGVEFADLGRDIGRKSWEDFGRAIEKAHGIGGIREI